MPDRLLSVSRSSLRCSLLLLLLASLAAATPAGAQVVPSGGEFPVNQETLDEQNDQRLAVAPDGTFALVWESFGQDGSGEGIFLRRFAADGTPLGDEVQVNTETVGDQVDPDIAALAGGGFVVVWDSELQDGSLRGIYGQRYDAAGDPAGSEVPVNATTEGDQNDAVVAGAADGGFLVAWETQPVDDPTEELVARRFDAAGSPVSGEMAVNTTTAGDQEDLDLASDAAGRFVFVWESDGQDGDLDSVVARLGDTAGTPEGAEIPVNTFSTGNQDNPRLLVRPDGSFAVAWEDDVQDATAPAVFLRLFRADGAPTTGELQINAGTGADFSPRLAFDPSGGVVVTWDSFLQDGDGAAVLAQHLNRSGAPRGAAEVLNLVTTGNQGFSQVGIGADARGLAVWTSPDSDVDPLEGLFGRRFEVPIFWDDFETGDLTHWSATVE
ncbi:MAG: hypothetical protein AAF481_16810 [Acidobacteriota bacterium]